MTTPTTPKTDSVTASRLRFVRRIGAVIAIGAVVEFGGLALTGCPAGTAPPPTVGPIVEAAAPVVSGVCTILSAIDPSGTLQEICAFLPDILSIAAIVVPLFAANSVETCSRVPGAGCYTNAQRLEIIFRLRMKDAGPSASAAMPAAPAPAPASSKVSK